MPTDKLQAPAVPRAPRKSVSREELITATLRLIGPYRSISSLSLREVARAAGIAPNSFYRHFRDLDELAVALIDQAGVSLRQVIRAARQRISSTRSVVRSSVEAFFEQLQADSGLLQLLLREGTVGSKEYKQAVERELRFFEEELSEDLIRLAAARGNQLHQPALTARAITRLMFAMGAVAIDLPRAERGALIDQTVTMLRMIIAGSLAMQASPDE